MIHAGGLVIQTRFHRPQYLTVGSSAVKGQLSGGGLQGLLGFASYLPLCGEGDAWGEGITTER